MRIEVYGRGMNLSAALRAYAVGRVSAALGSFAGRVAEVSVSLSTVAAGGAHPLRQSHVVARLSPFGSIPAEATACDLVEAIALAADRLGRDVARELELRRVFRFSDHFVVRA